VLSVDLAAWVLAVENALAEEANTLVCGCVGFDGAGEAAPFCVGFCALCAKMFEGADADALKLNALDAGAAVD